MFFKQRKLKITLIVSSALLLAASSLTVYAADPEKKLLEIERELKAKKGKVEESIRKEKSILSTLQRIDLNIKSQEKELQQIADQITGIQVDILSLSKELTALKDKLSRKKTYLKERLRVLYRQHYGGYALILFTAKDQQDLIRKSRYVSLIANHDATLIATYRNELRQLDEKKQRLEILRDKLDESRDAAAEKKKGLITERSRKDRILATIRSKRSTYEKAIRELETSSKELQEMIRKMKEQSIPGNVTGKGFRSLKGRLPWPVSGEVVAPFGQYKDPKFNITMFKNGIEIRTRPGDKPRAVAGGRVVYADWFKGYGLLLIIDHGDGYHSLYGNLSEIFHSTGAIISKGTVVGETGDARLMNFPTLYFEIRFKGKPVDPLEWLKKTVMEKRNL